jgi:hypothetical protein
MKKIFQKIGGVAKRVCGFIGGFIFAVILILTANILLRLTQWEVNNTKTIYAVTIAVFPFIGSKFNNVFICYFTPIFNILANLGEGGSEMSDPSTHDKWADFFMDIVYLLSLFFYSLLFSFPQKSLSFYQQQLL